MKLQSRRAGTGARILAAAVVITMLIAGCSSAATAAPDTESQAGEPAAMPAASPAAAADDASRLGGSGSGASKDGAPATDGQPPDGQLAAEGPLIIRTGTLSLQVGDLDAALAKAQGIVTAAGGYIAAGQRTGDGERATASITYRIPAAAFDATLAALRGVGSKLLGEQITSDEVTAQVVDLAARVTNLRASEAALQRIMDQATKIPDILSVQVQLTSTRDEIERLVAQQQTLEKQAALATLTVGWSLPPAVAVATVQAGWDPAGVVDRAVATLVGLGQGVAETGIWLGIVALPILLVLAVPLLLVAVVRRRRRRPTGPSDPTVGPPAASAAGPSEASALWPAG